MELTKFEQNQIAHKELERGYKEATLKKRMLMRDNMTKRALKEIEVKEGYTLHISHENLNIMIFKKNIGKFIFMGSIDEAKFFVFVNRIGRGHVKQKDKFLLLENGEYM